MSTRIAERKYKCYDDCKQSGCPGHVMSVTYQSTADVLSFDSNRTGKGYFDPSQLAAFLRLVLDHDRAELQGALKREGVVLSYSIEAVHEALSSGDGLEGQEG